MATPYIENQNYRFMEIVDVILCGKTLGHGMLGGDISEDGNLITDGCDGDRWITWAMITGKKQEATIKSRNVPDWASQSHIGPAVGAAIHVGKTGALSFVLKTGDGTKGVDWNFSWPNGSAIVTAVRLSGAEQDSLAQVEYSIFLHATCQSYPMLGVSGNAGTDSP